MCWSRAVVGERLVMGSRRALCLQGLFGSLYTWRWQMIAQLPMAEYMNSLRINITRLFTSCLFVVERGSPHLPCLSPASNNQVCSFVVASCKVMHTDAEYDHARSLIKMSFICHYRAPCKQVRVLFMTVGTTERDGRCPFDRPIQQLKYD